MAATPAIQRADLQDQVYETVKQRVLAGDLGADARLTLQGLSDELAVSRTPVHHALNRLVAQQIVDIDSRGFRVRPVTVRRMEEAHDVRCVLELYAAERTVGSLGDDHLTRLRALLERTVECVENFELVDKHEYALANKAFHEYLVDLAGNKTLSGAYRSLNLHELMERILFSGPTRAAGNSSDEHKAIIAAYERGDLEAARSAITANVETGRRIAIAMIEASGGELSSTPEVASYRDRVTGSRALFAFGLTQDFFREDRSKIPRIMDALLAAFADLEERFGVRVLGTLDDDEMLVGATDTWPWTCYILAEVPDRAAVASVCNLIRETEVGDARLWKYLKIEARLGRPLFFAEQP